MKVYLRRWLLLIFFVSSAVAKEEPPKTLESSVDLIISKLSPENLNKLKQEKRCNLIGYHHGLGTNIRNSLGLWQGNQELIKDVCGSEGCHPDDVSMKIIHGIWNKLNDQPLRSMPVDICMSDRERDKIEKLLEELRAKNS